MSLMTRVDQCNLTKRTLCAHGKYLQYRESLVVADIILSKLQQLRSTLALEISLEISRSTLAIELDSFLRCDTSELDLFLTRQRRQVTGRRKRRAADVKKRLRS